MKRLLIASIFVAAVAGAAGPTYAQGEPTCRDFWNCVTQCTGDGLDENTCEYQCSMIFNPWMICSSGGAKVKGVAALRRPKAKISRIPAHALDGAAKPVAEKTTAGA